MNYVAWCAATPSTQAVPRDAVLLCLAHHCELAVPAATVMQVKNGARMAGTLGDSQLYSKMEEASELIKRDIIFAASLYVT
jgi:hypothetical protein